MNPNTKNPLRIAAAVALVAALATAAHAGDVPQVRVRYGDLNLNNATGAAVLYQRIRAAAAQVCDVHGTRDLARVEQTNACKAHALAEAVAAVGNPALTAVYEVKMGATPATRLATAR